MTVEQQPTQPRVTRQVRTSLLQRARHTSAHIRSYAHAHPFELAVLLAALTLHMLAVPYYTDFADEFDNILGGQLIRHGLFPNVGFFSHHMPLAYYLAALLTLLSGDSFIILRALLLLALYASLLLIYRRLKQNAGVRAGLVFVMLVSVGLPAYWGHMLLAENIIAYSVVAVVVQYGYHSTPEGGWTVGAMLLAGVLAAVPALASQSYVPLSAWMSLFLLVRIWRHRPARMPGAIALFATPYLLLMLPVLVTGNVPRFMFEAYDFNMLYYAQFARVARPGLGGTIFELVANLVWSIEQAAHGFTRADGMVSFLGLMVVVAFIVTVALQQGAEPATLSAGTILLAAPRGGIAASIHNDFHGAPYYVAMCLAFAVAATTMHRLPQARQLPIIALRVLLLGFCVVVPITFAGETLRAYTAYVQPQAPDRREEMAAVINTLTGSADRVWVAPFELKLPTMLAAQPPTRYTFWAPWHAVCNPCTRELLQELAVQQPKLIYWEHGYTVWGHNAEEYGRPVLNFIEAHYARLRVPPEHLLANLYFLPDEQASTLARLRREGYLQGSVDVVAPGQGLHDTPVGNILPDKALRQELTVHEDGLVALEVLMATYGRQNYGPVVFRLRPLDGPQAGIDVAGATVDAGTLKDDSYFRLTALHPLPRGRYELRIEAPAATSKNCVTAWMQADDPYPQGTLHLGNEALAGDLTFRLVYGNT